MGSVELEPRTLGVVIRMKSRHRAREIALQILYQYDLNQHSTGKIAPTDHALVNELVNYYNHFKVAEELREFIGQLVVGTLKETQNLDSILEKHATHWKISRMSSVDRSLLRMALYEMTHMKDTPRTVVIDEAVELAKQFGTAETPAFINGILDQVQS